MINSTGELNLQCCIEISQQRNKSMDKKVVSKVMITYSTRTCIQIIIASNYKYKPHMTNILDNENILMNNHR